MFALTPLAFAGFKSSIDNFVSSSDPSLITWSWPFYQDPILVFGTFIPIFLQTKASSSNFNICVNLNQTIAVNGSYVT